MKDSDDQTGGAAPRTVRCAFCGYDVPAAIQNADGSKTRAEWNDLVIALGGWRKLAVLLGLAVQDTKTEHMAPCGRACMGGPSPPSGCPGIERCAECARMKLEREDEVAIRASGACLCETCGKPYSKHPYTAHRFNDAPYLNRLCDGTVVKL